MWGFKLSNHLSVLLILFFAIVLFSLNFSPSPDYSLSLHITCVLLSLLIKFFFHLSLQWHLSTILSCTYTLNDTHNSKDLEL